MASPAEARSVESLLEWCQREPAFSRRYDLSTWEPLGEGQFACVGRLHDRDAGRDVAVKLFWRVTPELRMRIQAEVANAQRIRSDTVMQIHSLAFGREMAWLQMELVDGPNLEQEMRRRAAEERPFTLPHALALAADAAEAVAAAHAVGVVHRDVKPSNFLLPGTAGPRLKLGDFGISRHQEAAHLTATGEFPGTPAYAAPEVFDGQQHGAAADVYSLGIVVFRLLAGDVEPYRLSPHPTPLEFMVAHKHGRPRRLRELCAEVPPAVDEVVHRALARSPQARPDAAAVRDILCRALAGERTPRRRPFVGRVAAAAVALALTLRSGGSGGRAHAPPGAHDLQAPRPAVASQPPPPPAAPSVLPAAPQARRAAPAPTPRVALSAPPPPALAPTASAMAPPPVVTVEPRAAVPSMPSVEPPLPRAMIADPVVVLPGSDTGSGQAGLHFELKPREPRPGEPFAVHVYLANQGPKPLRIARLGIVRTVDGARHGRERASLTQDVRPRRQEEVARIEERWPEKVQSWRLEVFVTAKDGATVKGSLSWR